MGCSKLRAQFFNWFGGSSASENGMTKPGELFSHREPEASGRTGDEDYFSHEA